MIRPIALAAALSATLLGCGPQVTTPRRLWLNVPRDGFRTLEDVEPPPF